MERRGEGIALVALDRPDKRNALNRELRQAIIDAFDALGADDDVEVVVVCGSGGMFCAGFDLDELMAADDHDAVFAHSTSYHHAVHSFAKPLVAAIEGAAVAGGMDLALMCDLRVAATDARFGQPQVKMGVPASFELVRTVVPEPVARELCLTGRIIDADEATEVGLVNRSVEPGGALEAALTLAGELAAAKGPATMQQVLVAAPPELFTN